MIIVSNVSVLFSDRKLFEDVSLKLTPGHCYGVIGANGAGKSTFLKVLSGEIESSKGEIHIQKGSRMAVLKQNHFAYEDSQVIDVVIMGYQKLYQIMKEKEAIYAKPDFNEEDGMKAANLEGEFAEMNGWNAHSDAATLLEGLGISVALHDRLMSELDASQKIKVLLAQALFGDPDILLLDEPTNGLDIQAIRWLEEFLINYEHTVLVVSHDRHFLNKICTHILDVDYGKIQLYVGNYDFWYESSQLAQRLMGDANKKKEDKIKELQAFIARFSANASKSKQATSRKKMLDKIQLDDIKPSNRRYPFIQFKQNREVGNDVLRVENLSYVSSENEVFFKDVSFTVRKKDKIAFISRNDLALTALLQTLAGEQAPQTGEVVWGVTTSTSYMPKDNAAYFDTTDLNLVDWLRQYSPDEQAESFIRSFLGRMLFSQDEPLKKVKVLSGGEKMRCMFARMMLKEANVLLLDDPTNHLDLESITALNNGLIAFPGTILFSSHDQQFVESIANRIIELTPNGIIDREMTYEEYLEDERIKALQDTMYQ